MLAPTGGTTASPKAVMLTHRNLLANAMQLRNCCPGADGEGGVLGVLPFFHSYGLTVALLTSWAKACTLHLHPRFEARAVLELLEEQRPDLVPAVPAMLAALNKVMRGRAHDLSFIRMAISGASALEPEVRREFESYGANDVVEGYGLTEASPVTHANPPGDRNRPGTIGLPLADTEARLADPDTGAPVQGETVGELVVRGPQVMKGYFNNRWATEAVLRDGWLYTGDMARRDADGYYTIVDRKRDIIKTSGFLVFPAEVEEVIRAFPGVAEAAVIGVPDAESGEVVKALVVPRAGLKLDVAALESHCGCTWASRSDRGGSRWWQSCRRISWARCCAASCASRPRPTATRPEPKLNEPQRHRDTEKTNLHFFSVALCLCGSTFFVEEPCWTSPFWKASARPSPRRSARSRPCRPRNSAASRRRRCCAAPACAPIRSIRSSSATSPCPPTPPTSPASSP